MPTALLVFEFIGTSELMIIAVVALIIFGPRKLPELGRSLGRSLGEFKRASEDFKRTWEYEVELEQRSGGRTQAAGGGVEGTSGSIAAGEPDTSVGGAIARGSAWHEDAPADADTPAADEAGAATTPDAHAPTGEDPAATSQVASGPDGPDEPNEPRGPRES